VQSTGRVTQTYWDAQGFSDAASRDGLKSNWLAAIDGQSLTTGSMYYSEKRSNARSRAFYGKMIIFLTRRDVFVTLNKRGSLRGMRTFRHQVDYTPIMEAYQTLTYDFASLDKLLVVTPVKAGGDGGASASVTEIVNNGEQQ
jgi:hypothetical protein